MGNNKKILSQEEEKTFSDVVKEKFEQRRGDNDKVIPMTFVENMSAFEFVTKFKTKKGVEPTDKTKKSLTDLKNMSASDYIKNF